jgi:hypothetical protein
MSTLRIFGMILFCTVVLTACGSSTDDGAGATDAVDALAGGSTLERFAGTWELKQWNNVGDTIPTVIIRATADTTGWTAEFPNREPIAVRVIDASGDLVVTEMGPFPSVIRPGVEVTVQFINHLYGEELRGHLLAIYNVNGPSAILRGRTEGRRIQQP